MTVLIAAAGDDGRTARDLLAEDGFDVERVTSLQAARVRATTVDVVVVGALGDATADDLRGALQAAGADPPLVHLGADETFDTVVERPLDGDDLAATVRRAEQAGLYRRAVDDLYEQCRERAESGEDHLADDEAVVAAKRRAEREFREIRRLDDHPPFEQLFGQAADAAPADRQSDESEESDGQT